ncbi:MAG: hypothetical protein JJ920_03305 [Roseitalea sp.]|jgi:membrane protein YqaA with SNARE-associated domain|nr:hypothetical protein [Roseitalea sp.]MBO6723502.1 hypothetical protein [Roseitalea sp.]MBO6741911.1 hypothetical protein [Roseitalea sp.]
MFSLRFAAYLLIAPVLAGSFVVALLTVDMFEATYIAAAAIAGAVIGIPAAWWLANKLDRLIQPKA